MTTKEAESILGAVEQGIGLSKRDRALGVVLEETGEDKDSPKYWAGFRAGLVEGYEGCRREVESGGTPRPIADIAAEARAEAEAEKTPN